MPLIDRRVSGLLVVSLALAACGASASPSSAPDGSPGAAQAMSATITTETKIPGSGLILLPPGDVLPKVSSRAAYALCSTRIADCDPAIPTNIQLAFMRPDGIIVTKGTTVWAISWLGLGCPPNIGAGRCDKYVFVDSQSGEYLGFGTFAEGH